MDALTQAALESLLKEVLPKLEDSLTAISKQPAEQRETTSDST